LKSPRIQGAFFCLKNTILFHVNRQGLGECSSVAAGLAGMKWATFLTAMIASNLLISVVEAFLGTAALTRQSALIAFIDIALIPFLFALLAKSYY
tara:strand:+ start:836 stop:1120 length:285 start_codon:yes stop_codon:yes gene_type:complete